MTGLSRFDFYPRDWISGTRELSAKARGVYIDLLTRMYDLGKRIDYDEKELCRFLSLHDRRQLRPILKELFDKDKIIATDDGKLTNGRFEKELEAANRHIEYSRKGGHAKAKISPKSPSQGVVKPLSTRIEGHGIEEKQPLNPCPPSPSPSKKEEKYAFRGEIIRLTEVDFNAWQRNYSHITDLRGWLQKKDDWLAALPKEELGNWFRRTSTHLASDNEAAARQMAGADREAEAHAAGHLSSPL